MTSLTKHTKMYTEEYRQQVIKKKLIHLQCFVSCRMSGSSFYHVFANVDTKLLKFPFVYFASLIHINSVYVTVYII
jgi:hypothetical protein